MMPAEARDSEVLAELRTDIKYIKEAILELKGSLKESAHKDDVSDLERRIFSLEVRVTKLDQFRYWMVGAGASISALVTMIIEYLGHK